MINTSKDILNIVLASSVAILTGFICWGIYYLVSIVRNVKKLTDEVTGVIDTVKNQIEKIDHIISVIQAKAEKVTSHVGILSSLIERGMDFFAKKRKTEDDCPEDVFSKTKKSRKNKK